MPRLAASWALLAIWGMPNGSYSLEEAAARLRPRRAVSQFELGGVLLSPSLASILSASISQSCANWMRPGRAVNIRSFVLAAFARHSSARARYCRTLSLSALSLGLIGLL